MKCFCINLTTRNDKWNHVLQQEKFIGKIEKWEATDGNLLEYCPEYVNPIFIRGEESLTLSKGEWGILDSTVRLWKYILNNNIDKALILEDDIILNQNLEKFLNSRFDNIPSDWDIVLLGGGNTKKEYLTVINNDVLKFKGLWFNGAYSYLINKQGIKKILKYLEDNKIEGPLDCFIANCSLLCHLNIYKFTNNLFRHNELGSNIWHCGGDNKYFKK